MMKNLKFVVFRTDRIGDTVLSIQTAQLIKRKYPDSSVTFVVSSYTKPLFNNNPFVDNVLVIDNYSKSDFLEVIKSENFDVSIVLFNTKLVAKTVYKAKIPIRIGPMSKLYGLFYYNYRIKQTRSKSIKNEAQYNIDLLKPLDIFDIAYPKIYLTESEKKYGQDYLKNLGYDQSKKLVIMHPGSGGSSKDWPLENYFKLAQKIKENNIQVFMTGSDEEISKYTNLKEKYGLVDNEIMAKQLSIRELLSIINTADILENWITTYYPTMLSYLKQQDMILRTLIIFL